MTMQKFDEMYTQLPYEFFTQGKQIRDHYKIYDAWLARQPGDMMAKRREEAEMIFRRVGITFAVYGEKDEEGAGTERLIPFVDAYVDAVDLAGRRITVDWGLDY